jgi:Tol biopolymer transport system component
VGTLNSNIWRVDLTARDDKAAAPERLIASSQREVFPQYSPDGRQIVFYSNRSGADQIWVCDADGSKAAMITAMKPGITGSPRWSPDGHTISFDSNVTGSYQIYTVGADGGKVRQMTSGAVSHYAASWSRDGHWIYFASNAAGDAQVWKIPSQGGDPVQVTRNGGMAAQESPDGKTLYYNKALGKGSLWKMPVGGGPETMIADSIYRYNYAVTDKGVYLMSGPAVDLLNPDTGERKTILKTREPDLGLTVSPDGRWLLYSQVDAVGSDLMLVENFR